MDSIDNTSEIASFLRGRQEQKLPLKLAILDIDNTFSGDRRLVDETRQNLEQNGYAIIFASTRTEELMMTKTSYDLSVKHHGFTRPEPQSGFERNTFVKVDPIHVVPKGQLDPSVIIGSTGTQVYFREQDGSYAEDKNYTKSLQMTSTSFRESVIEAVRQADPGEKLSQLGIIEQPHAYEEHRIDVAPPLFRLQVQFEDEKAKRTFFTQCVLPKGVKYVDDSFPQQGRIKGYFLPEHGGKSHAVNHLLTQIYEALSIYPNTLHILMAGDSFPDLIMTREAAPETNTICLIAGGSRLTDVFTRKLHDFAGESVTYYQKEFQETRKKGVFKREDGRQVILGDIVYPGTIAVETLAAWLATNS